MSKQHLTVQFSIQERFAQDLEFHLGLGIALGISRGMDINEKVLENRLRRSAARQGLRLVKSRRRDPQALTYGTYGLIDLSNNTWVVYGGGDGYGVDLDIIERELAS
ncbi:hypothetical protein ACEXQB_010110 [Herbiconiux sp. P18]|uniref:hypothetical protein n=1 Tax=Herbiconiux liangxiaofengii TaxID=3342795 RepID=UPI0035B79971